MAEKTTWIKIDRNILNWRWYQDNNAKVVFLHLLLTANIKDHDFQHDTIHRGQTVVSIGKLAKTLGITYDQTRRALERLKSTNEVQITRRPKYLVISIVNYDKYQAYAKQTPNECQADAKQTPILKEYKNEKNIPSVYIPTRADLAAYIDEAGLQGDPDEIFDYYEAIGWKVGNRPVKDWKALCRRWRSYSKPTADSKSEDDKVAAAMRLLEERDRLENDEARSK